MTVMQPQKQHPLRTAELHVYRRTDGMKWLAHFNTLKQAPITFTGNTEEDVVARAETFRAEALEKHEAAYNARQLALEKARAAKKAAKQ